MASIEEAAKDLAARVLLAPYDETGRPLPAATRMVQLRTALIDFASAIVDEVRAGGAVQSYDVGMWQDEASRQITADALPTVPGMAESDARLRAEMAAKVRGDG